MVIGRPSGEATLSFSFLPLFSKDLCLKEKDFALLPFSSRPLLDGLYHPGKQTGLCKNGFL